jgi:hypothetical protein
MRGVSRSPSSAVCASRALSAHTRPVCPRSSANSLFRNTFRHMLPKSVPECLATGRRRVPSRITGHTGHLSLSAGRAPRAGAEPSGTPAPGAGRR